MNENRRQLSVEEAAATIKRSSLPTLVVEGTSDQTFFQSLEKASRLGFDFISVGGKTAVLALYKIRNEFERPVVFVADRDVWVFVRKPKGLESLVLTSGYSIENDLLDEFQIRQALCSKGVTYLDNMKEPLSKWFAYQIGIYKKTRRCSLKCPITQIVDKHFNLVKGVIDESFAIDNKLYLDITSHWWKKFRGKTLLDVCFRAMHENPENARMKKRQYVHNVMVNSKGTGKKRLETKIINQFKKLQVRASKP